MQPAKLSATIYQGATFRLALDRVTYPYAVTMDAHGVLRKSDGSPAPDTDRIEENYTGCSARAQMRLSIDSDSVIHDFTDDPEGIVLAGKRLSLFASDTDTSAMTGWQSCICHVEIIRSDGDVERQYEITFSLDREVTR